MIDNKVLRALGLTEAMLCHLDGDSIASPWTTVAMLLFRSSCLRASLQPNIYA